MKTWFKIYPCVSTVQGAIDALALLIERDHIRHEEVEGIEVGLSETAAMHGSAIYEPRDVTGAQFSLPFSLALRLLKNDNDLSHYMDQSLWRHATLLDLASKVKTYGDPQAKGDRNYAVKMEVKLSGGRISQTYQEFPRGCPLNPVGRSDLRNKFERLAGVVVTSSKIDDLIDKVDHLENLDDVSELVPLLISK
jgi:2-methylcitrate dehydratase PrpD